MDDHVRKARVDVEPVDAVQASRCRFSGTFVGLRRGACEALSKDVKHGRPTVCSRPAGVTRLCGSPPPVGLCCACVSVDGDLLSVHPFSG